MNKLQGKVAIVTGSGSGMGRASARLFAQEGAKVIVADLASEAGQETVSLIKEAGGEASFVRVDVSNVDDIENMVKAAVSTYGGLNVLYNNAGTPGPGGLDDVDVASWDMQVAINRGWFFGGIERTPATTTATDLDTFLDAALAQEAAS